MWFQIVSKFVTTLKVMWFLEKYFIIPFINKTCQHKILGYYLQFDTAGTCRYILTILNISIMLVHWLLFGVHLTIKLIYINH